MTKNWNSRKERLARIREGLPEGLRKIPISTVDEVSSLPPKKLELLAGAYSIEKINIPRAVELLKAKNETELTPGNICDAAASKKRGPKRRQNGEINSSDKVNSKTRPEEWPVPYKMDLAERDAQFLSTILKTGYPDMPQRTAECLAEDKSMREILAVITAIRLATESRLISTEQSHTTLLFIFDQVREAIHYRISYNPELKMRLVDMGYKFK